MNTVRKINTTGNRRGSVVVFVTVGIIMMLSIAALVVDLGMGYTTKTQLQNAVDAAALAGAGLLDNTNSSTIIDTTNGTATLMAKNVGAKHTAGGNQLQSADFTVAFGRYSSTVTDRIILNTTKNVNAIKVSTNNTSNTTINTFFAQVFGRTSMQIGAKSTAYGKNTSGTGGTVIAGEIEGNVTGSTLTTNRLAAEALLRTYPTTGLPVSKEDLSASDSVPGNSIRYNNVDLTSGESITFNGTGDVILYVDGNFSIKNTNPFNIGPNVTSLTIYIKGVLDIQGASGNVFINSGTAASSNNGTVYPTKPLSIYVTNISNAEPAISMQSGNDKYINITASMYAHGDIKSTGNVDATVIGTVVASGGIEFERGNSTLVVGGPGGKSIKLVN